MADANANRNVESVIVTDDLGRRPSRAPNYEAESRTLTALAEAMGSSPGTVLQRLVEAAMALTRAQSAGISLLEAGGEQGSFRWVATAGAWAPYRDATMPRAESPCGEAMARAAVLLVRQPERAFPALLQTQPGICEGLLAPFHIDGKPVGTVWTIKHSPGGQFEAEDARILASLARFAAAAHQVVLARRGAEAGMRRSDGRLRENEERQAFLLQLSDALRPLVDAGDIQVTAARLLGERLRADRAAYYEVDAADRITASHGIAGAGVALPDNLRIADFGQELLDSYVAGRTVVVGDMAADQRFSPPERDAWQAQRLSGVLGVPLVKRGRLCALLALSNVAPRVWTEAEVALTEEVAERTWAAVERARAEARLRNSEARFRGFAENSADVLWIADRGGTRLDYLSPAFERTFGEGRAAIMADLGRWAALVHPDDRAAAGSYMPRAVAGKAALTQYRVVRPADGRVVHLRDTGFPIRDAAGAITQVAGIVQDVTDMVQAGAALGAEKERFRTLAEGIPQLVWRSGDDGLWTWSSPQWQDYTGQTQADSRGWGWLDAIYPGDQEAAMQACHAARPHGRLDMECRVRRARDGAWRWHATRSLPVRAAPEPNGAELEEVDGRILEWLGTTTDIEDLKRLQGQQQVLVAELQHRTRNLLAVVRNVARRSIGPSPGRDEYDARLAALGRVQGFLSRSPLYTVPLAELVAAELVAVGNDAASAQVTVGGPAIDLPGEGVQAVALALHELATNAVKYGAMAQPAGRLSVTWRIEDLAGEDGEERRRLVIEWRESKVAMPDLPPLRRGYGSELITRALPYQLGAETELAFTHDGVCCRIVLPAGAFIAGSKARP